MVNLIERKRDGKELTAAEITKMVQQITSGEIPDFQVTAMLMAIYFRGMTEAETAALTIAFTNSGERVDLSALAAPAADKHSTGGVGDKVSLALAPLASSLGLVVPMMSGRSLGHTGGTLNKLESIPGARTNLTSTEVFFQLSKIGVAIFGATEKVAPVDKIVYGLRDKTGTTKSLPLITSSIMSKKIAEGAKSLVLDVKSGRGAFLADVSECLALARSMVAAGEDAGVNTVALITDMSQPLGHAVGNWLEVREAIEVLNGKGPSDVRTLVVEECAQLLLLSGLAASAQQAREMAAANLDNGAAFEKFQAMVIAQGGEVRAVQHPEEVAGAAHVVAVRAAAGGFIATIDALRVAQIGHRLGGSGAGREDSKAGVLVLKKVGERVEEGSVLGELHGEVEAEVEAEAEALRAAFEVVQSSAVEGPPLISHVVSRGGTRSWAENDEQNASSG